MRINTNIASMNAQTNAANTNKALSSSLEKLSSGLRINKAADDASGMAIADKLRTQASSIGQGISNANSGSALIQIADKALGEQSNILDTVKTKLIQASTSTTSAEGREAIRKDVSKLLEQFDAIAEQTNYNGINLLNNKGDEFSFQTGENADSNISMELNRAVNTKSLGAEQGTASKSEGTLRLDNDVAAGSIALSAEEAGGEVTVQTSGGAAGATAGVNIDSSGAGAFSVEISGQNVDSIKTNSAASTLKTDDAATIERLDQIADNSTTFNRNGSGSYTLTSGNTVNFGEDGLDLSKLQIDVAAGGDIDVVAKDEDITIKKLSSVSTEDIEIGSTQSGGYLDLKSMNDPSKVNFMNTTGLKLDEGSISVKADAATAAVDAIGINTVVSTATTDQSVTIDAEDVTEIQVHSSGVAASVVISTEDAEMLTTLENSAVANDKLTNNGDGTFTLTASAATGSASLSFDGGMDISNLTISGIAGGANGAGANEQVYIVTDENVTITNNTEDAISIVGADMDDVGTLANVGEADGITGAEMSKTVIGDSLDNLKDLGENGLTADKALSFMASVDTALSQLNEVRSDFGSTQSQVETAIRSMMVTKVNIQAAESVIRDTDYASESASFNKQNIIAQAGTYAMSQANAMAQNVQKLLQ